MKAATRLQLMLMMFLEFFIWGAWFVTLGTFVLHNLQHTNDGHVGQAFLSQSFGAIIAPFIIGLIADRYIAAQIILGILHLLGAALLWYGSTLTDFTAFYPLIILYMILYMPTLALVNTVSFRQMKNPSKEFPPIRTLGTLGWIVAGLTIGYLAWEQNGKLDLTFKMAAIASVLLGLLSFTLPHTPPTRKNQKITFGEIIGLDALRLLKNKSYLIFFLASIAICVPLSFYYNFTNPFLNEIGMKAAAGKMALGQGSELIFMVIMPLLFVRLGVKKMLAVAMLAWVLRYVFFAYGNVDAGYWMLIGGIVLHGVCYDFFFVTGQIYTDNLAGPQFKSAAQGMITLATYGVGMLIGSYISGPIVNSYKTGETSHNWTSVWLIPAGIALVVLVLFVLLFKDRNFIQQEDDEAVDSIGA
ncbi:nucleoside transporter [Chitinophaga costaii]|uniref:Nucleoside transporter n=1 Tax=Chitinophaga costaii TaxID=1335309 RepID=A0A1C4F9D9_9BACT|nr:nucleoside permease [Chitinophaga costaii]PUZ21186.1 MFS transporter [Chitinophaga costaii]SCC52273.1 nucleoside transporter [Chitinophaga costaii]